MPSPRMLALLQALFVTFLWSTSWVLIEIGLEEIPALVFAGLRYGLAFVILLPVALARPRPRAALRRLSPRALLPLAGLGVLLIAVTQGAQFVALSLLPTVTVSLFLSFTPVLVGLFGWWLLRERFATPQVLGVALFLAGAALYLRPEVLGSWAGLAVALLGVAANGGAALLGRAVGRLRTLPPLVVTTVSMGVGSALLLALGLAVQGMPALSLRGWLIVVWLAGINTAFAFTLWNQTLRTLTAVESSVVNNTMLIQIAILAYLVLGETQGPVAIAGLVLAAAGTLLVQLRRTAPARAPEPG